MLNKKMLDAFKNVGRIVNKKPEKCYATLFNFKATHMFCDCDEKTGCKYGPQEGLKIITKSGRIPVLHL